MIPTEGLHELSLPDGGTIVASLLSDSGIHVTRFNASSRQLATLQLDQQAAGFGGAGWVISPSGKFLILHWYSGQSEEAFNLINLSDEGLELVANPHYHFGEYASYAFSPTEETLVMALPRTCVEWWNDWANHGLETADDNVGALPFATLLLCSTVSGQINQTEVEIVPAAGQPIHKIDYNPDLDPCFITNFELLVRFPWASAKLDLSGSPSRVRVPYPS